jgi:peroxiredoxin (alkyl hydroperoxide reductase subunit C)
LIDERVKIFHESVNDMPLGNVNEYIRMVDAYTHTGRRSMSNNWEAGKEAMSADRKKLLLIFKFKLSYSMYHSLNAKL